MKKYLALPILAVIYSCASLHTPSPHFVPSITKKNQFEGEAAAGLMSASVNFAYSPLNRLNVMANVQVLPTKNSGPHYQRNCEMAIGTYGSGKRIIYGFNTGYGMGAYNWDYNQFNDSTTYSLRTKGNFQKLMVQVYIAITDEPLKPNWMAGISLKENFYWDQYTSLKYTKQQHADFSGLEKNMSFEPCVFVKNSFAGKFYVHVQAGMNISCDRTMFWLTQYVFTRIGLGMRLGS